MTTAGQHSYAGNPVAIELYLAEGTPLPSREDLLSSLHIQQVQLCDRLRDPHQPRQAQAHWARGATTHQG
jgi:hypothetical protein